MAANKLRILDPEGKAISYASYVLVCHKLSLDDDEVSKLICKVYGSDKFPNGICPEKAKMIAKSVREGLIEDGFLPPDLWNAGFDIVKRLLEQNRNPEQIANMLKTGQGGCRVTHPETVRRLITAVGKHNANCSAR